MENFQIMTEGAQQEALFEWAAWQYGKYPELRLMYHIPNEGKRSLRTGARLKREGMKKGVSDICLPVARGKYHGLYIELKTETGKASKEQIDFLYAVSKQGYSAHVCYGLEHAQLVIKRYLSLQAFGAEDKICTEKG